MNNLVTKNRPFTRGAIEGLRRLITQKTASARQLRILIFMAVLLFCYTIARAYLIPFVHDESYSFLNAVNSPLSDVLSLRFKDANNHPLNTWGMFFFLKLFGSSELSLRLPNLLAHLIYLFASLMIVRRFPSRIVAISSFLVLNLNIFLLEFFALARGYGLGSGFLMLSIWLAASSIDADRELRSFSLGSSALVAGTLAVLSNYTFIYFYVSLPVGLLIGRVLRSPETNNQTPNDISSRSASLLLLVFAVWNSGLTMLTAGREIIALRRLGAFYVGGVNGFWQDTIRSIFDQSVVKRTLTTADWIGTALEIGMALILILSALLAVRLLVNRRFSRGRLGLAAMVCVFFCSVVLVISAFVILDVNYPQDRSAVFLIPLLGIPVIFVMNEVSNLRIRVARVANIVVAVTLALILSVNFLLSVNFESTTIWPYDADTRRMLEDLEHGKMEEHGSPTIRLGIDWWFAPTINFYRVTQDLIWLEPVTRKGLEGEYDYYYFHPGSFELMEARGVQIIREYETTGNRLGKSK